MSDTKSSSSESDISVRFYSSGDYETIRSVYLREGLEIKTKNLCKMKTRNNQMIFNHILGYLYFFIATLCKGKCPLQSSCCRAWGASQGCDRRAG
jgi:hypothetical protein